MKAWFLKHGTVLIGLLAKIPARRAMQVALLAWVIYTTIIVSVVAYDPKGRTATKEYQKATANWWGGEKSLYRNHNGYLYFPQFAQLYTPYELLPDRVGEPLWRLTCLMALALALFAVCRHLAPEKRWQLFLLATILVMPSSFASARNGQVNMPLAALALFTALTLSRQQWWASAGLLVLALVLKPIAIAPLLLVAVVYPKTRWPLVVGLGVFLVVPFLHPNPTYVAANYVAFVENLVQAGKPTGNSWCDFAGIFRRFGLDLPSAIHLPIRAIAGIGTLFLCWQAVRSLERFRAAFMVMFLSVVYLMLFNPRTETNSYVMLGAFIAICGAWEVGIRRALVPAAWFVLLAAILGTENYGGWIFRGTNLWLKAIATCALAAVLIVQLRSRRPKYEILSEPSVR